jgi:hypothetical protein
LCYEINQALSREIGQMRLATFNLATTILWPEFHGSKFRVLLTICKHEININLILLRYWIVEWWRLISCGIYEAFDEIKDKDNVGFWEGSYLGPL